jgi:hypothetical protein
MRRKGVATQLRERTMRRRDRIYKERMMAIQLQALPRFTFDSFTGGPNNQALTVGFSALPLSAVAAISGFSIGYEESDHHLLREEIDVGAKIQNGTEGPEVRVGVNFSLRDSSGTFDDAYSGFVDVVLIVDLP